MIAALQGLQRTIEYADVKGSKGEDSFANMKISSNKSLAFLFRSHPPLEVRIKALQQGNF